MKGNGTMTPADETRLRIYRIFGHGGITHVATALQMHRVYVSNVLNGSEKSASLIKRINEFLDEHEAAEAPQK